MSDSKGAAIDELKEKLADIEHQRWSDWQKWVHSRCLPIRTGPLQGMLIPPEYYQRWEEQIAANYSELSEKEKQSDRDQVDRYWPLIESFLAQEVKRVRIEELKKALEVSEEELYHGRAMAEENDDGSLDYGVEAKYFEERIKDLERLG